MNMGKKVSKKVNKKNKNKEAAKEVIKRLWQENERLWNVLKQVKEFEYRQHQRISGLLAHIDEEMDDMNEERR